MVMMKGKKGSKPKYNYHGLLPNVVFNYIKYKTGDQFEKFLTDVFQKHIREYYDIESLWGDAKTTQIETSY